MTFTVKNYRAIFPDIQNRDAFIEQNFPKRRCLDTPGAFAVPGGYLLVNQCELAYEIADHKQDTDCLDCGHVDPETNLCFVCGVEHLSDPCIDCGAHAYHKPACPLLMADDPRVFACDTFCGTWTTISAKVIFFVDTIGAMGLLLK